MNENLITKALNNLRSQQPVRTCAACGAMAYPGTGDLSHAETCPAYLEERLRRVAEFAGLPADCRRTFDNFKMVDGVAKALAAAKLFCDSEQRQHHFLTLAGAPGRGKTHLAQAIGWYWAGSNLKFNLRYYQAEKMLDQLRRCFDRRGNDTGDNFDVLLNSIMRVSLLIIDDLGTETGSDWSRSKIDEIIDERYENKRLTVITSNLRRDQMLPRVASRIGEGVVVVLQGEDYRHRVQTERPPWWSGLES